MVNGNQTTNQSVFATSSRGLLWFQPTAEWQLLGIAETLRVQVHQQPRELLGLGKRGGFRIIKWPLK